MDTDKIIQSLLAGGHDQVEIAEILNNICNGDLEDALNKLHDLHGQDKGVKVATQIRDWIEQQDGWFDTNQLDREIGILSPQQKHARRMAISRLKSEGVIEASRSISGKYRYIDKRADKIDWQNADGSEKYDLKWAFPIQEYCYLVPGNIAVVAGSSDAGKTGLLLDFTYRNMDKYPIIYFSSEMGDVELNGRLSQFERRGIAMIDDWNMVDFRERSHDFADVVEPGCVNVIDYLEMTDNFYAVGGMILAIWEKLAGSGLAIINLQKEPKAELGRGGQFSMEKARLYLTMDSNKITIKKGKNRMNPSVNPNGKTWTFTDIWGGCEFIGIREEQ